jgi:hypothetical protein
MGVSDLVALIRLPRPMAVSASPLKFYRSRTHQLRFWFDLVPALSASALMKSGDRWT